MIHNIIKKIPPFRTRAEASQNGIVVIEMAICVPILLIFIMASAEFGRLFYQYNTLIKSLTNATRYISEHALSPAGVFELTSEEITNTKSLVIYANTSSRGEKLFPTLNPTDIEVSGDEFNVTVSVSWIYETLFGTKIPVFDFSHDINISNLALRASLSMRALN